MLPLEKATTYSYGPRRNLFSTAPSDDPISFLTPIAIFAVVGTNHCTDWAAAPTDFIHSFISFILFTHSSAFEAHDPKKPSGPPLPWYVLTSTDHTSTKT